MIYQQRKNEGSLCPLQYMLRSENGSLTYAIAVLYNVPQRMNEQNAFGRISYIGRNSNRKSVSHCQVLGEEIQGMPVIEDLFCCLFIFVSMFI